MIIFHQYSILGIKIYRETYSKPINVCFSEKIHLTKQILTLYEIVL